MDLIHRFLNLVAPPFTFFSICFLYPPYLLFRFVHSILSTFTAESLTGKVAIITGASSGIGEHLAYEYAKGGACLALVARRENSLREVADRAVQLGSPDCIVVSADVSKAGDCRRIVDETITHFGRLDHLVNNAGLTSVSLLEDIHNIADFRVVMDTNFWGSVYTTHHAIPYLRSTKGKIVVLSSVNPWMPIPGLSIYNASKSALLSLYETLRIELKPDVQVTIVTPGFIESEMTQGKFLLKEGKVEVDQDMRDVKIGPTPVLSVEGCARRIVAGVRRGDKYLTVPSWLRVTYLWRVLWPEMVDWSCRFMYMSRRGAPPTEAMSKKILDATGVHKILYPVSIQSPEVKTD